MLPLTTTPLTRPFVVSIAVTSACWRSTAPWRCAAWA
jgi:hypothetical protein